MVDEEVDVLSESLEVPFEDGRVRGLEHPGVVAELLDELLDYILLPFCRGKIFCDAFRFEHENLRARVKMRSRLLDYVRDCPHLRLVPHDVSSGPGAYPHL